MRVLDLCSSFDSHLPPQSSVPLRSIIGHGMNDAEMAANSRLTTFFLLDLNDRANDVSFPMGKGQAGQPAFPPHPSEAIPLAE